VSPDKSSKAFRGPTSADLPHRGLRNCSHRQWSRSSCGDL